MRSRKLLRTVAAVLVAAVASPSLAAQDGPAALDVGASGWVAASTYVRPNADDMLAAAGLRGGMALDGYAFDALGLRLSLEGYSNLTGLDDATDWVTSRPDPLSKVFSGNDRLKVALDIKEAWLEGSLGAFDLRIGKQLVAWGLADGNNPTDNVNARHVGTRLVSSLDEQKLGTIAANLVYNLPGNLGTIQGLFMPVSVPNDMPEMTMDIFIPSTGMGVPSNRIIMEADEAPDVSLENLEGGLRSLLYLGNLSVSADWLSYLDRYADYEVTSVYAPPPVNLATTLLVPFHGRVNQFGLDAAWLVSGFDLRSEGALTLTSDSDGSDPSIKNSSVSGVVQASRSFFDGVFTTTVSWAPRFVLDHRASEDYTDTGEQKVAAMLSEYNGQYYAFDEFIGVRFAGKLLGENLQPDMMLLASPIAKDWMVNGGATYNLADGLNLKAGFATYGSFLGDGDADREYGTFSNSRTIDQDYVYLELRLSL